MRRCTSPSICGISSAQGERAVGTDLQLTGANSMTTAARAAAESQIASVKPEPTSPDTVPLTVLDCYYHSPHPV